MVGTIPIPSLQLDLGEEGEVLSLLMISQGLGLEIASVFEVSDVPF